uniref:Ionotropic glutamate receptor C-terminal domain-containing protein n=2 Tax=Meloidogyne TaxID=189290 RepID=A0A915P6N4_9BILA
MFFAIFFESFSTAGDLAVLATLNFTVNRLNSGTPSTFLLAHKNRQLRMAVDDSWGMISKICTELQSGFMLMLMGESNQRSHEAYMSVVNALEIPLINWELSPHAFLPNTPNNFEASIKPPNAQLLADLLLMKGWNNFVYFHDSDISNRAAQNLRMIYLHLNGRTNNSISSEMLQLPKDVEQFGEFLRQFNLKRFKLNLTENIILDTKNNYRQQQLLQAIRSAQFNQQKYNYVVANYDFLPYDVEMFQQGNINITGFQIIERENREFALLKRQIELAIKELNEKPDLDLETRLAFVHDAVLVAKAALEATLRKNDSLFRKNFRHGELYNKNFPGIYCYPSMDKQNSNRPFLTFEHGRLISKAITSLKLSGSTSGTLSGQVEFDRDGVRKNFLVTVIDLTSDTKSAFNKKELLIWRHSTGFLKDRTEAHWRQQTQNSRSGQSEGGPKKIVRVVTVRSDPFVMLKRECDPAKVGHLLRGEADVSVASLTINQDRERVVDFSKPFLTTGISIMIKKPDKQEFSVFSFMAPLSSEIWIVEEMANGGFTISNDFSVYNCMWFTLAAFMQQGTDILPRSISGRIASSAWWFFTMIIEKMQAPIESVEDLAKQTKIKYGIQAGGSTAQFFKYSSVQIYQRMWRFMESQVPSVFVNSYAEGIERVRTHKGLGANLNSVGYGVATPFGSEWKDVINLAILALQELGELKKLENKWWYDRGQCDQGITDGSSASLNLSKVAGIFYILMAGMIASMIAALGEFLYRSRIEARKGQITSMQNLRDSLCDQLKLSLQGNALIKDGSAHEMLKKQKISSLLPANYSDPGLQPFTGAGLTPINPRQVPPPYSNKNSDVDQRKNNSGHRQKIQRPYNTAV